MCTSYFCTWFDRLLHCLAFHRPTSFSYLPLGHLLNTDRIRTFKSDQLIHHGGNWEVHFGLYGLSNKCCQILFQCKTLDYITNKEKVYPNSKVGHFDLILEFMDIHIQIKSGSYLYIQLLSCSLCFFLQKMDTLAFSKIFYGVHIHCSSKQIKTSVSCSCNSEVFFCLFMYMQLFCKLHSYF